VHLYTQRQIFMYIYANIYTYIYVCVGYLQRKPNTFLVVVLNVNLIVDTVVISEKVFCFCFF
jgi:hypothetical protein